MIVKGTSANNIKYQIPRQTLIIFKLHHDKTTIWPMHSVKNNMRFGNIPVYKLKPWLWVYLTALIKGDGYNSDNLTDLGHSSIVSSNAILSVLSRC